MQTTSFQGVSPQFAATKPSPQTNVRTLQTPLPTQATDSVRFGNGEEKAEKTNENSDDKKSKDPNFFQKSWRGFKRGLKEAFSFGDMGRDLLWGTAAAIASFIIPPHAHALVMVPLVMLTFGMFRFGKGVWKGFKGEKAD